MIGLPVLNWKTEMHFSFILVKVTYIWICDDSSVIDADYNMVCLMFVDIYVITAEMERTVWCDSSKHDFLSKMENNIIKCYD